MSTYLPIDQDCLIEIHARLESFVVVQKDLHKPIPERRNNFGHSRQRMLATRHDIQCLGKRVQAVEHVSGCLYSSKQDRRQAAQCSQVVACIL
ncbi:hypothetical protein GGF41_007449 [Coemansia sp. RSA 2531]|nr:hypothetical protein GGF41_007449 [Coemansia sp. RSA 2531]